MRGELNFSHSVFKDTVIISKEDAQLKCSDEQLFIDLPDGFVLYFNSDNYFKCMEESECQFEVEGKPLILFFSGPEALSQALAVKLNSYLISQLKNNNIITDDQKLQATKSLLQSSESQHNIADLIYEYAQFLEMTDREASDVVNLFTKISFMEMYMTSDQVQK